MGINDIDDLKPSEDVIEVHPEWPTVRCVECNTVYQMETPPNIVIIEGNCPNCHSTKFQTHINQANNE